MAKLHVPAPEGPDDRSDMYLAFLAAILLFALAGIGMFRWERTTGASGARTAVEAPAEALDPVQLELKAQRKRSEELAQLSAADLEAMQWTDSDRQVVFRFGPRLAAETICRKMSSEIEQGTLSSQMRLEIEKTLDRRTEFAPWTCMSRLFLAGKLPEGDLRKEMEELWAELEARQGNPRIPISILTDFRETRDRPENPRFYAWARMCALDFEYQVGPECRRILHQISPQQGADLLQMLEKHWAETGLRPDDMPIVVAGLGHLARNGQPHNWKVAETKELPDYDVDFRQATVGYLCRMVNTPTPGEREGLTSPYDAVPEQASEQLSKVGLVGARSYEEKLLLRWRETCRLAFGGHGGFREGEERVGVPLLAVWNGDLQALPDYSLAGAQKLGTCKPPEGYPQWACLSESFKGEGMTLDRAVAHFFIETRYMEWDSSFDEPDDPTIPATTADPNTKGPQPKPQPQQPQTKNQEPRTKNQEPRTKNQEPKTKNQEPKTKNQEPKTKNQEPEAESPEPSGDAPSSTPEPPDEASPTAEP